MQFLTILALGISVLLSTAATASAQQCDAFPECTVNGICSEGTCVGEPRTSGSCDDGNACTVNDQCAFDEFFMQAVCRGTAVSDGTACNDGCGACTAGFCLPALGQDGRSCSFEFGLCDIPGVCGFGSCIPQFEAVCPSTDPCDFRFCNPLTGQCEDTGVSPCAPCATCQPLSASGTAGFPAFDCVPLANGTSCDDSNECTGDGTCQDAECLPGAPVDGTPVETPEPTATPPAASPTPVSTNTAPPPSPTPTEPLPTSIPTETPTSPAATPTEPLPTPIPTETPTSPAATPTEPLPTPISTRTPETRACVGDCGNDGQVTVDELIVGVNIALGEASIGACQALDASGEGQVTVDEILLAVNNALDGCPS